MNHQISDHRQSFFKASYVSRFEYHVKNEQAIANQLTKKDYRFVYLLNQLVRVIKANYNAIKQQLLARQ